MKPKSHWAPRPQPAWLLVQWVSTGFVPEELTNQITLIQVRLKLWVWILWIWRADCVAVPHCTQGAWASAGFGAHGGSWTQSPMHTETTMPSILTILRAWEGSGLGPFLYPLVSLPFIELTPLLSSLLYLFSLFTFFFSIDRLRAVSAQIWTHPLLTVEGSIWDFLKPHAPTEIYQ